MLFFVSTTSLAFLIFLGVIFILGMVFRGIGFLSRRGEQMRAAAKRLGLRPWPDNSLPRGLSFNGTPFFQPTRLSNIYEGKIGSHEVVILDFKKMEEESGWSSTVIAIKTTNPIGQPSQLECRKAGQWQLISPPIGLMNTSGLMEVERLEFIVKNIIRYQG
jgi:hypothetical protein